MLDEGTLRERFPEIPWDQPVPVQIQAYPFTDERVLMERYCCRYCIAMHGLKATELAERGYVTRIEALDHIEREHHD